MEILDNKSLSKDGGAAEPKREAEGRAATTPTAEMDEKAIRVIARLIPEKLVCMDRRHWCNVLTTERPQRYCFRKVGHADTHVTGRGCTMKSISYEIIIDEPLHNIVVWE